MQKFFNPASKFSVTVDCYFIILFVFVKSLELKLRLYHILATKLYPCLSLFLIFLFKNDFVLFIIIWHASARVCKWKSEDTFVELVLAPPFYGCQGSNSGHQTCVTCTFTC